MCAWFGGVALVETLKKETVFWILIFKTSSSILPKSLIIPSTVLLLFPFQHHLIHVKGCWFLVSITAQRLLFRGASLWTLQIFR